MLLDLIRDKAHRAEYDEHTTHSAFAGNGLAMSTANWVERLARQRSESTPWARLGEQQRGPVHALFPASYFLKAQQADSDHDEKTTIKNETTGRCPRKTPAARREA